jgi:integrase-like protein
VSKTDLNEAMSLLRRRMIEDITIRKLAPKTQQGYIRTIKDFAAFLGRSPATASFEDVRRLPSMLTEGRSCIYVPMMQNGKVVDKRRVCARSGG